MRATLRIAILTFREAGRRKVLWAAVLLALAFLALYATGFHYVHAQIEKEIARRGAGTPGAPWKEIYGFFSLAGLYVVHFLSIMMAVLASVDTLSGEIQTGVVQSVVTKPLRRWNLVAGKWLGFAVFLAAYVVLLAGGVLAVVYATSGFVVPNAWKGVALIGLEAVVLLSVSFAGGTRLSTLANGVLAFGLYGIAFIGGWIEQIGALPMVRNQTAVDIGIASSLLMPVEAVWRRAAWEMQSPLARTIGLGPFSVGSPPNGVMIAYAGLYAIAALAIAVRLFGKRDL